jgi:hypothetical protein
MKGTLNIQTQGGRKAWVEVDVIENKGVNQFEISAKREELKAELGLDYNPGVPHVVFLQLPSKMNQPGFLIEEEGPY